jgi:hypothetical protein
VRCTNVKVPKWKKIVRVRIVNLIFIGNCVMSCVFQFLYRIGHGDNHEMFVGL